MNKIKTLQEIASSGKCNYICKDCLIANMCSVLNETRKDLIALGYIGNNAIGSSNVRRIK